MNQNKDKKLNGIVQEVVTGQSVGNCGPGAPQSQAGEIVSAPDNRLGNKPIVPVP